MKAQFGCIITDGSGKLGGKVVSKNHYGKYLKIKVSPTQPASTFRDVAQGYIRTLSRQWGTLTDAQRQTWFMAEHDFKYKNVFGDTYKPAGYNLFLQHNINLLLTGQSVILTAPSPGQSASLQFANLSAFNSTNYILLDFSPSVPSGFAYKVYASSAWSAGINYGKDKYRYLGYITPETISPYDLSSMYNARLGSVGSIGKKIFLKLVPINLITGEEFQPWQISCYILPANTYQIGAHWTNLGQVYSSTGIAAIEYLGNGVCLAGDSITGHIFRSINYGLTWSDLGTFFGQIAIYQIKHIGSGICLASTGSGGLILRSTNYGLTWTNLGQMFSQANNIALEYIEPGICLCGTSPNGLILRSTDYGLTWTSLGTQYGASQIRSICYLGSGIVLAGTRINGKILRSTNYGLTWSDLGQQYSQTAVYAITYLGNGICLTGSGINGLILRSTNYGLTWSNSGQLYSQTTYDAIAYCGGGICIAGSGSGGLLLRSIDYGLNWSSLGQQYGQSFIYALKYLPSGIVLAATYNGGLILRSTLT